MEIELQSNKKEDRYIVPFVEHRFDDSCNVSSLTIVGLNPKCGKTPDYYLREVRMLVEVKGLVAEDVLEASDRAAANIVNLEREVERLAGGEADGNYAIVLPHDLRLTGRKRTKVAREIVKAVKACEDKVELEGGTALLIERLPGDENNMGFSDTGYARFTYNDCFRDQLRRLLREAAEQLAATAIPDVRRRAVLFVCPRESDYRNAGIIIKAFREIFGRENRPAIVDEVWLQVEKPCEEFRHYPLYQREWLPLR